MLSQSGNQARRGSPYASESYKVRVQKITVAFNHRVSPTRSLAGWRVQSCSRKSRLGPRSKTLVGSSINSMPGCLLQAAGVSNVVYLALYRRRLCWRFRRRPRRPASGEAAMTDKHTALEAISASLRDVTSLRDFIAAVEVGASPSPC